MDAVENLAAVADAPIAMTVVDHSGSMSLVNDALCALVGRSRDDLVGARFASLTHPDDVDIDAADRSRLLTGEITGYRCDKRYLDVDGRPAWAIFAFGTTPDGDQRALLAQVIDISERKEQERRMVFLLDHDLLTGAANRLRFERELTVEIERARRYGTEGAVVLLDLDSFKDVNDTFGHKAGDDLLRGITAALQQRVRHTDVLARLGGDEFAVLLPVATLEDAAVLAGDLVKAVARHSSLLGGRSLRITASAGVAAFVDQNEEQVLARADHAMYEAKSAGRNRVVVDAPLPPGVAPARDRIDEVERLRAALREDRFELYCQPILDLATGVVAQFELFLRLREHGELISPGSFLYAAERFGLIEEIDCWVIGRAAELVAQAPHRIALGVNLSAQSLGSKSVAARIERAIQTCRIEPASLIFEVAETAVLANIDQAATFAERVRSLGCRFALDSFGSGFASFVHLRNLELDIVKIDGDFVRGLSDSPTDQLIVEAIARIAAGMGKQTIADFVTDRAALDILRRIGVGYAQGRAIGRPAPVATYLAVAAPPTGPGARPGDGPEGG
jgi:diguanylate cyclase (GGDEF)-like protein/PAS domain S-box-containing protein